MRRIRTGNDFSFIWEIEENGQAVDLALTTDRKLVLKSAYGDAQITDYTVNSSQVSIDFDKATVCKLGRYSLVFSFVYLGRDSALDVDFVEIVGKSAMADEAEDIVMTSDLLIGLRGADAFQVWQSQSGNEGKTYDDYIAYLREPMTQAIEEGEQTATEWAIVEAERVAEELIRKEDEEDRRAAEVIREQVKDATIVAKNEAIQTNADIQAEEEVRATAETGRVSWYNSAVIWYNNAVISIATALSNIATAIGLSNTATQNANTVATNVANAEAARVASGAELKTNKTSDIESNKTSVDKYPNVKGVVDYVAASQTEINLMIKYFEDFVSLDDGEMVITDDNNLIINI